MSIYAIFLSTGLKNLSFIVGHISKSSSNLKPTLDSALIFSTSFLLDAGASSTFSLFLCQHVIFASKTQ